jgi:O-antigen/teichoic acid export membrane protein
VSGSVSADSHAQLGRIARGGALNLAGSVVSAVSSFLIVVAVANYFDENTAGMLFAATSLFIILEALTGLGTDTGMARFVLRFESQGRYGDVVTVLRSALVPASVASVLAAVALFVSAPWLAPLIGLGDAGGVQMLRVAAVALPFATLNDVTLAATRAFGKMRPTVLVDSILRCTAQLVAVVVVGAMGAGAVALAGAWTLPYLLTAAIATTLMVRVVRSRASRWPEHDPGDAPAVRREFWIYTWPRSIARVCQIAIQRADIIIIAAMIDPAAAAVYTAATRFVVLGQFSQVAIQRVLQPRLTALLSRDDHDTVRDVFKVSTAWSIALSWPLYLATACAAPLYLQIFGPGYRADGVTVVVVMAIGMMLAMAAGPLDTLLLMAGGSRTSLWNTITALVVDIGLCLLLIPVWGITGAAVAWAASVVVRNAMTLVQVHRMNRITPFSRAAAVVAGAAVLCFAVPLLIVGAVSELTAATFLVTMVVGGGAYALLLWFERGPLALSAFSALLPAGRRGRS